MDILLELINREDEWFPEIISKIKASNIQRLDQFDQFDLIDVLEVMANQCRQAREMGWLV
ncbi:MAG TPA: hypothetical protein VJN02_00355 [Gammaproteobacteria bacterium]|nr:hypothetical protein [Gammaproteobacteria bacterium]